MAIFNSVLYVYQRVYGVKIGDDFVADRQVKKALLFPSSIPSVHGKPPRYPHFFLVESC